MQRLKNQGIRIIMLTGDNQITAHAIAEQAGISEVRAQVSPQADVEILQGSLLKVTEAIVLSNATVININQNLIGAFFYNMISTLVAAGLLYPIFGVLLNPMIAGAAMALFPVTVVSNANRLRWIKLVEPK